MIDVIYDDRNKKDTNQLHISGVHNMKTRFRSREKCANHQYNTSLFVFVKCSRKNLVKLIFVKVINKKSIIFGNNKI